VKGQAHRTIPPGPHRFQADVETVHNLMEQEFYEVERFASRADFLAAANHYQLFFNLARRNSAKEGKTPWNCWREQTPQRRPAAAAACRSLTWTNSTTRSFIPPPRGGTMSGAFPKPWPPNGIPTPRSKNPRAKPSRYSRPLEEDLAR